MQRLSVTVVLAVCLALTGFGPGKNVDVKLREGLKKPDCIPEYHNFTCRSWDITPVKEPMFVDPVFKEIDCVAEPYHFVCRSPSSEQPVLR